jgi:3-hydroxyacyl-[acyl-carrier-protein] dehydratase
MRFLLLDKITALVPGQRIEAIKNLTLAEEYLADHFPLFPVMPGVFMLEALTQTSAWLIRATDQFSHSMITLAEARNVKYADFFGPGMQLRMSCELTDHGPQESKFKVQGLLGETVCVSGRLVLTRYNLADQNPLHAPRDRRLVAQLKQWFHMLYSGPVLPGCEFTPVALASSR